MVVAQGLHIYKAKFALNLSLTRTMADRVLRTDEIKVELVDTCILICSFCKKQEEIYIKSDKNMSPFYCEDCEGIDEEDYMQKMMLQRTSMITSQTITYYLPFSCPENIVAAKIK